MAKLIGFDIGSRLTKITVGEFKNKFYITNFHVFKTPYKQKESSWGELDEAVFYSQVSSFLNIQELSGSWVGVTIPSDSVSMMIFALPKMPRNELETSAIMEAKRKMIPPPGPESVFRFEVLRELYIQKVPRYELIVIKSDSSIIKQRLSLIQGFGNIVPHLINPACYFVPQFFHKHRPALTHDVAFVDLGYQSINITITYEKKPYFYRTIPFGIKEFIRHHCEARRVEFDESERIIYSEGISDQTLNAQKRAQIADEIMRQQYASEESTQESPFSHSLRGDIALQEDIDRVVHELRRTLLFYKEQSGGRRVGTIYFYGGGSLIPNLLAILSKRIGGSTQLLEASFFPTIEVKDIPAQAQGKVNFLMMLPAIAMVTETHQESRKKYSINFLPGKLKGRIAKTKQHMTFVVAGIVSAAVCWFLCVNAWFMNIRFSAKLNQLEDKVSEVSDIFSTLEKLKKQEAQMDSRVLAVGALKKEQIEIAPLLEEIGRRIPAQVFLREISIGKVGSDDESSLGEKVEVFENGDSTEESMGEHINLRVQAACIADYEQALSYANRLKREVEKIKGLSEVKLILPELEVIAPQAQAGRISLTPISERVFTVEAKLIK